MLRVHLLLAPRLRLKRIALLALLPLVVLSVRLLVDARRDVEAAHTLGSRGDGEAVQQRVAALGRAARAWLPLGPSHAARTELAKLGREGIPGAWEELRASILATRWLVTPDPVLLDEANRAVAERRARLALPSQGAAELEPARVDAQTTIELGLLRRTPEPSRVLSVLALLGLALFLWGAMRALGGQARLALVSVVGFALFVMGLALA